MKLHTILLTGADGMLGKSLASTLLSRGYNVHALTRRLHKEKLKAVLSGDARAEKRYFYWNVEKKVLPPESLAGVDAIVHLAGESIAGGRWTDARKASIRNSRIASIELIYETMGRQPAEGRPHTVVSASATGYYPDSGDSLLNEDSPPGSDFMSKVCLAWEDAVRKGQNRFGLRSVCLRTGAVLSRNGGLYTKLRPIVRRGLGMIAGSGKQWMPWVHEYDAVQAYLSALENPGMEGPYNLVAPHQVDHRGFMKAMARVIGKRIWLPAVPSFLVRAGMGDMSALLLDSARVSPSRLQQAGFEFRFQLLEEALGQLESRR